MNYFSASLINMCNYCRVLSIISNSIDIFDKGFGPAIEGATFSGEVAEVTEDNDIYFDTSKLRQYDDDVVMAIIAHELAHSHLCHYEDENGDSLKNENEADELARKWGFDIDKFRKICAMRPMPEEVKAAAREYIAQHIDQKSGHT